MFRALALALDHAQDHGASFKIYSADRRDEVLAWFNRKYHQCLHGQQYLIDHEHDPGFYPADPIDETSHCLYSDGNPAYTVHGHQIPARSRLPDYMLGIDAVDDHGAFNDCSQLVALLGKLGYEVRRPYPGTAEAHHLVFVVDPIPNLRRWGRLPHDDDRDLPVGIDVAHLHGRLDWPAVERADRQPLAFAFAQATFGLAPAGDAFAANWHGLHSRGVLRGAYHHADLSQPGAGAEQGRGQAQHFLAALERTDPARGELPPALKLEAEPGSPGALRGHELAAFVEAWVAAVEARDRRKPTIHTSASFWSTHLGDLRRNFGCRLWVAHHGEQRPPLPPAWPEWAFWQFGTSAVEGIPRPVNVSRFRGTAEELHRLWGRQREHHPPARAGLPLRIGSVGPKVEEWQRAMRRRGFVDLQVDGHFGPQSARSCRWLQLYLREQVTEEVNAALWDTIVGQP